MLDKQIFKEGMERLSMAYPSWGLNIQDKNVMKTWYSFFEHNTEKQFENMIREYCEEEEKNPTIAKLLDHGYRKSTYKNLMEVRNES